MKSMIVFSLELAPFPYSYSTVFFLFNTQKCRFKLHRDFGGRVSSPLESVQHSLSPKTCFFLFEAITL